MPLVIRGARQVGKTWLVRDFAEREGRVLLEINLERDPRLARSFAQPDPRSVFDDLTLTLDEIQNAPEVLARLRWFAEELPELPVIAAGSLLEFALRDFAHRRKEGGSSAEIDYLVEVDNRIVPVEIKSGAAGAMKSLHQFMYEKALPVAVRLDRNPPTLQDVDVRTTQGPRVRYQILNLPHYLAGRLPRLLAEL